MNDIAAPKSATVQTQTCIEQSWPLTHITLAGLHWPASEAGQEGNPLLMLHGWLDNGLTFARLAPELTACGDIYAIDMAGHGHSGHRPGGQAYLLMDYVADLAELVDTHFKGSGEKRVDIVGHSLGGIVALLYSAAYPERVGKLMMIDSLGPISRPPSETIGQLRKAIDKRIAGSARQAIYPDIETAARAREGGLSPLSPDAAMILTPRNMKPVDGGYVWRTDPRLRHPSPQMMDEAQVIACLEKVRTPTLFLRAESGLLAKHKGWEPRVEAVRELKTVPVPGGHHCHLDGDIAPVVNAIRNFTRNAE